MGKKIKSKNFTDKYESFNISDRLKKLISDKKKSTKKKPKMIE